LISGGKARSLAAAELAEAFPDAQIVTLSKTKEDQPAHSAVIAGEIAKKGVEKQRITEDPESYSALTELMEIIKLIHQRGWKQVALICNEYQIDRPKLMLEKLDGLNDRKGFSKTPE